MPASSSKATASTGCTTSATGQEQSFANVPFLEGLHLSSGPQVPKPA